MAPPGSPQNRHKRAKFVFFFGPFNSASNYAEREAIPPRACVQFEITTQADKKSISPRFDPWYLRGCPPNWTVHFEGLFGR